MNKKILAAVCIIMGCLLMACGKDEETQVMTQVTAQPIESTSEEPEESSRPEASQLEEDSSASEESNGEVIITDRVVVDGKKQSYLTGEWKDEDIVNRRSMAVMIPNNKPALPQYGISKASIIYEAPVEGRVSRLMAFFEDYDDLEFIGPVRSSRDYFVYEAMAYDAIYCNWGLAVPFVEELLRSDRIDNISASVSGIHNPADEAFDRRDRPGNKKYALEYTGYLYIDGYNKAVERLGYEPEYRDTFEQAFTFAADGHPATYDDEKSAVVIYPGGSSSNSSGFGYGANSGGNPYFEYHEDDGLYYRYEYGEMNGEQLTVSNIVFKICHGEVHEPTTYDYLAFNVHGTGEAYVFTAGKVIHGTWSRESDRGANMFYDEDGNEIIFNQGKTWICNIWKEYSEYMKYE